jgi:hypothetical protein
LCPRQTPAILLAGENKIKKQKKGVEGRESSRAKQSDVLSVHDRWHTRSKQKPPKKKQQEEMKIKRKREKKTHDSFSLFFF